MACGADQVDILGKCCGKSNVECIQVALASKKPDPNTLDYIVQILSTLGTIAPSVIASIKQGKAPPLPEVPQGSTDTDNVDVQENESSMPIWGWILIGVAVVALIVFIILKKRKKI